jgi:hypothetical protein
MSIPSLDNLFLSDEGGCSVSNKEQQKCDNLEKMEVETKRKKIKRLSREKGYKIR